MKKKDPQPESTITYVTFEYDTIVFRDSFHKTQQLYSCQCPKVPPAPLSSIGKFAFHRLLASFDCISSYSSGPLYALLGPGGDNSFLLCCFTPQQKSHGKDDFLTSSS